MTEQCEQMEPVVHALFTICDIDGKTIVSAEIPAADRSVRPVFYKGVGRIKGSYVRVGESDEPMSEYEICSYEAFRKRIHEDIRPVGAVKPALIDDERLKEYLEAVKEKRKNLAESVSEEDILDLMGITDNGEMTLAGLLVFSKYPQAYFQQLCITAVALPGTEHGSLGESKERFLDSERITGSISEMLEEAVDFVRRNSRTKTIIDENGRRIDKEEYPVKAVREAILNALVHRDYSEYTENTPISIEMYRDRMEITNSGGLYGKMSVDSLGKSRPETRNAALANILELMKVTENRYSGIPTMRREFELAGLPEPEFSVVHGEFKVTMRNGRLANLSDEEKDILEFCSIPRTRDEIVAYCGKSRNYTLSHIVTHLIEKDMLRMTMPDKPKSKNQKFIKT